MNLMVPLGWEVNPIHFCNWKSSGPECVSTLVGPSDPGPLELQWRLWSCLVFVHRLGRFILTVYHTHQHRQGVFQAL